MRATRYLSLVAVAAVTVPAAAQDISWIDYTPRSSLVVPMHHRTSARFPFIDAHAHSRVRTKEALDQLVADMDGMNMGLMVNLSGGTGERLEATVELMRGHYPDRFVVFANLDYSGIDEPGWGERAAQRFADDVANGASGLKIFKNHGMTLQDASGNRIPTDDARFDPVWAMAGQLGVPVLIHTADPHQFWEPHDQFNERWYELVERPGRIRPLDRFPPWETLMQEHWNVIRRHRNTTFISAHLSWLGGNLDRLGALFDSMPNMYTELGAVLAELGRQPAHARDFLTRYQDRVLFGKDSWNVGEYHVYFRALETGDEYFEYYRRRHAFWRMYGMALPDSVLRKVYYENAIRIIPGIDRSRFPAAARALPYGDMAIQIMAALSAQVGERAILRYDPGTYPELAGRVAEAGQLDGVLIDFMPYGLVPSFPERLQAADIYVWLPAGPDAVTTPEQMAALGQWLDSGRGRQIHFHWGGGTYGLDGVPGVHSPTYDSIYVAALGIDYAALDRVQSQAIELLRAGEVHVTTPAGTDVRFSVGDRPFNKQNGDASRTAMATARTRIDREIEFPAGVLRVAPIERSVTGRLVVPWARFGNGTVRNLRLTFEQGRIVSITADQGVNAARQAIASQSALQFFREFAIGFNPRLMKPSSESWLPYYGYGAGVVRMSLGNNAEVGGSVTGDGVRWFFFDDATVAVNERPLVAEGRLEIR